LIAVDTNILIYAHQLNSVWQPRAQKILQELAASKNTWCIPWPCIFEYLSVVTNPRIFTRPTPLEVAIQQVNNLIMAPTLRMLAEGDNHWLMLKTLLQSSNILGAQLHDAKIYCLCLSQGVEVIYSADRDMSRFSGVKVVNPLIA
jgi:toxin-antitoxin system PIN domain toxin